jgi:hypothetical protein
MKPSRGLGFFQFAVVQVSGDLADLLAPGGVVGLVMTRLGEGMPEGIPVSVPGVFLRR